MSFWENMLSKSFCPLFAQGIGELVLLDASWSWPGEAHRKEGDLGWACGRICECRNEACSLVVEVNADQEPLTWDGAWTWSVSQERSFTQAVAGEYFMILPFLLWQMFLVQLLDRYLWRRDGETTIWPLRGIGEWVEWHWLDVTVGQQRALKHLLME